MNQMIEDFQDDQDIQNNNNQQQCKFCRKVTSMQTHIKQCINLQVRGYLQRPTFYRINGLGNLCRYCWQMFDQAAWQYHRKTKACRKQFLTTLKINNTNQHGSLSQPNNPHILSDSSKRLFSEQQYRNVRRQDVPIVRSQNHKMQDMLGIVSGLMSPLLRKWIKDNQIIQINVLTVYLTQAVLSFGSSFLAKKIQVPNWTDIRKIDASINWQFFLQRPENLFNEVYIDDKLAKMSINKQRKIISALNKLSNKFNGLIKKRSRPATQTKISRMRSYVKIYDVMIFIRDLFSTKKKQIVHFGLDCLIILLCGQRFLADIRQIQGGLIDLLNTVQMNNQIKLSFVMIIGKNKKSQQVALNKQLLLLLLEFGWEGFHKKSVSIVQRMNHWLGIHGYSFKDTMLSAVTAICSDLRLAQHVAGHTTVSSTRRYTKLVLLGDTFKVVSKLIVPDLHERFGQYRSSEVIQYLKSLQIDHLRYASLKQDWLRGPDGLLSRLYCKNYHKMYDNDAEVDFMAYHNTQIQDQLSQRQAFQLKKQQQLKQKDEVLEQMSEKSHSFGQQQQKQQQTQSNILVYGNQVTFNNGQIELSNFYSKVLGFVDLICSICQQNIISGKLRLKCNFCLKDYHCQCTKDVCSCTNFEFDSKTIPPIPNKFMPTAKHSIKISMPKKYMRNMTNNQRQIKKLLNLRAFKYVRIPMIEDISKMPKNYWAGVPKLQIQHYDDYISGLYFPSIKLLPCKQHQNHSVFGTQFGIFAQQKLDKNILIGQYACDILRAQDLIFCKKLDSIMLYFGKKYQESYLAPLKFGGFVMLVNSGHSNQINCKVIRCITKGALRVILYTAKQIGPGQQLLYSYGQTYEFH